MWEQVHLGETAGIWTVCAGEPPSGDISPFAKELHIRWEAGQNAPAQRRIEDSRSCQRLGATPHSFSVSDCIYRRDPQTDDYLYASEAALTGPLHPGDSLVMGNVQEQIKLSLPNQAILVCPLGLGNHVDHQLTRRVAEGMGHPLWYYADYPYVLRCTPQLAQMEQDGWISQLFPISADGLAAWMDAISAHGSQISTFWANDRDMRQAIMDYLSANGGIRLWKKPAA